MSTSKSDVQRGLPRAEGGKPGGAGLAPNSILSAQNLRRAISEGWISAGRFLIPDESVQPASLDLRLGDVAWPLRCSFLPDSKSTVEAKAADLSFGEIDLRDGAVLEKDRPYLIPLAEVLELPPGIKGRANPKSSTGRLDVFTRVITDRNYRFDEIAEGYSGQLYLEVVSRSFAIHVNEGLALNQLRLMTGNARLADDELWALHSKQPLLYKGHSPVPDADLSISDGLFLSVDLDPSSSGLPNEVIGYRAKPNSHPIDLSSRGNDWADYFEPISPDRGQTRVVLEPEVFYLLLSAEGVSIPPQTAAEMMAYDPTAGELRTHYAGFFDPGFGYDPDRGRHGSRAALEVRARDVPFMVEHRQPVCKLAFERLTDEPDVLYGEDVGSSYQGQETMLSKHFRDETAEIQRRRFKAA